MREVNLTWLGWGAIVMHTLERDTHTQIEKSSHTDTLTHSTHPHTCSSPVSGLILPVAIKVAFSSVITLCITLLSAATTREEERERERERGRERRRERGKTNTNTNTSTYGPAKSRSDSAFGKLSG
jgi:hypothetical protein